MRMVRPMVLLLAVLMLPSVGLGETAQEMLSACRGIAEAPVRDQHVTLPKGFVPGSCWGAFAVMQRLIGHVDEQGRRYFGICAPTASTRSQLVAIFAKYAENNPRRLHEDFVDITLASLQEAFPCQNARPTAPK